MKPQYLTVAAFLALLAPAVAADPAAGPMGPSAKAAAELEQNPPNTWIQHYLPEDRYKIGTAWKFVTTDLDTYYHSPDCPNMLRQSADNVIGFDNVREAEEAGYKADPSCTGGGGGGFFPGAMSNGKGGRVTLSDGRSSITFPKGWSRIRSKKLSFMGMTMATDSFSSASGQHIDIQIGDLAGLFKNNPKAAALGNFDFANLLTASGIKKARQRLDQGLSSINNSGTINSGMNNFAQSFHDVAENVEAKDVTIGGRRGLLQINHTSLGGAKRAYSVGQGYKYATIVDFSVDGKAVAQILQSFRPGF